MTLSHTIAHEIPPADPPSAQGQGKSVLLVFLSEDKTNHDRILDHVRPWLDDIRIQSWRPSNSTLQSVAAQGKHRDSTANLYGLAIVAHRAGWSQFLVADELTNRQISGNPRCGESSDISLVMMIAGALKQGAPGEVSVRAKRTTGPGDQEDLYETMRLFLVSLEWFRSEEYREADIYGQFGLQLHDPDRSVFSPDTSRSLPREDYLRAVDQVLSAQRRLPAELTAGIVSRVDEAGLDESLFPLDLILDEYWRMCLLRPTTKEERVALQAAIREAVIAPSLRRSQDDLTGADRPYNNAYLLPWMTDYVATRRDLARLETTCCRLLPRSETDRHWMLDVPGPGDEGAVNIIQVRNYEGRLPVFMMEPMEIVIPRIFGKGGGASDDGPYVTVTSDASFGKVEVLYDPAAPFYPYPPPFLPVDPRMNSVAVFCLTADLTPEELRMIQEEILAEADGDNPENSEKVCCIVPWVNKDADGGLDDMWEIFWEMTRQEIFNEGRAYVDHYAPPYFFIDRQSVVDKKIIAVETYEYNPREGDYGVGEYLMDVEDPYKRGFYYGRIAPEETHLVRDNLSSGNMFFSELFDEPGEVKKYLRPGWPGHGILHDDWSEDEEDEDEQD